MLLSATSTRRDEGRNRKRNRPFSHSRERGTDGNESVGLSGYAILLSGIRVWSKDNAGIPINGLNPDTPTFGLAPADYRGADEACLARNQPTERPYNGDSDTAGDDGVGDDGPQD